MTLAELSDGCLVRYTGLAVVLWLGCRTLAGLVEFLRSRIFPVDFRDYGQWAVVTGSTDGIGKGLARQFAKGGLDIVLISRSEEKLKNTAQEIENDYNVKTICVQADFSYHDIYEKIEKALKDLDIAVLVNNVGIATEHPREYIKFNHEELQQGLNVNLASAVHLTRMVLPQMKFKRKGYIVNVSSLSSVCGLPYFATYASTKAFLKMFTHSLVTEAERYNIKFKCLIPGIIRTKIIKCVEDSIRSYDFMIPDCDTYVTHAYKSLSSSSIVLTGYWMFTIMLELLSPLPMRLRTAIMMFILKGHFQKNPTDVRNEKNK